MRSCHGNELDGSSIVQVDGLFENEICYLSRTTHLGSNGTG
jgi:hypothetical protein